VSWIRCARVVLLVARVAQRAIQRIVVVDMAIGTETRRHRVHARQLKSCRCMVESAIGPLNGVMAGFAGSWKRGGDVVHRRKSVRVIVLMARYAGRARQVVVVVNVAIGALARRNGVVTSQYEACAVVVEGCVEPRRRVVALVAALGEVRCNVIRIRSSLIVLQMARHAGGAVE